MEDELVADWTKKLAAVGRKHGACELCGRVSDLRPYGPDFEFICTGCGAKEPEAVGNAILHILGLKDLLNEEEKEEFVAFLAMNFKLFAGGADVA